MKSRKILVPAILVALVLIVTGICTFNKDSNTETAKTETSTTDKVNSSKNTEETPATDSNEGSSDSNKNTDSKDTDSSKDSNTSSNDKNAEVNKDSNASNNSDTSNNNNNNNNNNSSQNSTVNTIFTEKDAANLLLAYLLGSDELETQHLTPVSLADGTNIASEKADSNTFYFNSAPFTTDATDGIIITISDYNSANKTYNYELKDYADLLQGQADAIATGTVANNGEVTTN